MPDIFSAVSAQRRQRAPSGQSIRAQYQCAIYTSKAYHTVQYTTHYPIYQTVLVFTALIVLCGVSSQYNIRLYVNRAKMLVSVDIFSRASFPNLVPEQCRCLLQKSDGDARLLARLLACIEERLLQ